jgi:hypothetical protein
LNAIAKEQGSHIDINILDASEAQELQLSLKAMQLLIFW